ncbi:MAG: hypothetical protein ABIA91_03650 [Patescibacteria group bacterium]
MDKARLRKIIIQLVVIALIIIIGGVLVFNNFINKDKKSYLLETPEKTVEEKISSFDESIKVLEGKKFMSLIKFGDWPLEVDEKGKVNPFIKFE